MAGEETTEDEVELSAGLGRNESRSECCGIKTREKGDNGACREREREIHMQTSYEKLKYDIEK